MVGLVILTLVWLSYSLWLRIFALDLFYDFGCCFLSLHHEANVLWITHCMRVFPVTDFFKKIFLGDFWAKRTQNGLKIKFFFLKSSLRNYCVELFWFLVWSYSNIKSQSWLKWFFWEKSCLDVFRLKGAQI